ncbi:non-ribosomal peptide synthetase [Mucilaginibacter sp. SJ]|uniref:non-ribosomal peptide synthetase n=1 Tax=Mucilaginibacter sp. SJ TaxID=3029053 RepID=UPI0023A96127|nr:non-ribosomal peptide synthetase [Mucilaginibacter sp. SJ]WEA01643.1 amino acid adenylation domain-containing protein [Mucilaginibacter sp. SJ]
MKELLLKLKERGIAIEIIDDELRLSNIPDRFKETDLILELKNHKTEIIQYIKARKQENVGIERISMAPLADYYPASPQQRRLFFLHQMSPLSLFYNMSQAYLIKGNLELTKLKKAFELLIERHEILRTSFSISDRKVVQKISADTSFDIEYIQAGNEEVNHIISKFIRPFDLAQKSLFRVGLIEIRIDEHILILDMHHLISDGISQQILIREFVKLYSNHALPELILHYKDYSVWIDILNENKAHLLKNFWKNQFDSLPDPCHLPLDFPRTEAKNYDGGMLNFSIDINVTKQLHALAYRANTSLFSVLISAFGVLLSKLTGLKDIVIGTPVTGRTHPDLNSTLGPFVNTIPVRIYPGSQLTFHSYLEQVSSGVVACLDHQDYPLDQLIDDLNLDRSLAHNPLFDIVFVLQNIEDVGAEFENLEVHSYPLNNGSSKFDLSLSATEYANQINFSFEYSKQLYRASTIERFSLYLKKILSDIVQNEHILLAEVDILTDNEKDFLLNVNNNICSYPKDKTIVDLFEAQVKRSPEAVALVFEDIQLTYSELNRRSNQLAGILQAKGCTANTIVGLLTGRSHQTIIGILGILKAGGAYLPIDIEYPVERIRFHLSDSGVRLLVTDSSQEEVISGYPYECLFTDQIVPEAEDYSNLQLEISPNDLCYIIYTSGTTGKPKGVMINHKNVVRLLFNEHFQFDFSSEDVWTMFHSHTFDFSVWEMYGALLYGGKLVVIKKEVALDPAKYLEILNALKVTVLNQTPTAFGNLIQEDTGYNQSLSSLRYVIFGGEALKPFMLRKWHQNHSNVKLINMFGITETTVHVTYKEIGEYEIERNLSNVGKPMPTVSMYLFTENMQLAPTGVVSELYVGGDGVASGYLHNEELSAQRFLNNPYRPGERLYRTGDLGRLLDNGEVEYLGRADRQLQLRGFRIEPGEIEFHLSNYPHIDNALVVLKRRGDGTSYLCAYCITKHSISAGDLKEHLQEKIPLYMIPSYFIPISHLPQTQNGKVDIAQLPEPRAFTEPVYVAPETSVEKRLANIWTDELSVGRVGKTDNFFAIGGDSIMAIGIAHKINAEFNCNISIADLYRNQTIAALATLVQAGPNQDVDENYNIAIKELSAFQENYKKLEGWDESYEDVFPMNGVEKGMVFYSLKQPSEKQSIHEVFYHEQNTYRIANRSFDFNTFKKAVKKLTEKHAELRKIYDLKNFAHIIKKEVEPEVYFIDVSDLEPDAQEVFVLEKIRNEKLKATALDHAVLWRMNVLKIAESSYLIVFDMHHSLFDGWSLQSFMTELSNTYKALLTDPLFEVEMLRCSYKDQIVNELAEIKKTENVSFWRDEMAGANRLNFSQRQKENTFTNSRFALGEELRYDLERVAKKYNTSLKHLCFSAYIYTMKVYTSETDIVVGITTNNRPVVPDGDKLLGCYLNSVPFRITVTQNQTVGDYIKLIESKLQTLKKYERVPFQEIVQIAGLRSQMGNPFFDTFFNYTNFRVLKEMEILDDAEEFNAPYQDKLDEMSFMNLNTFCEFHVLPEPFSLYITYASAYFSEPLIEKLSEIFRNTLRHFVENEQLLLSQVDILSSDERDELLYGLNDTESAYPSSMTIMELFEDQVERTPGNIAVRIGRDVLTYKELKEKSDRIAYYLQNSKGVKTGDLVGLLLDRESELLPSIFGILKSGAVYVPLSPAYPSARIKSIISDSGLKVLISRGEYFDRLSIEMEAGFLNLDSELSIINEEESPKLKNGATGSDVGYIIYTSGSTGTPKGVMIEHHSIVNRLLWMQKEYELTEDDVLLQKTPLVFDVSIWELFWWSFTGASVCLLGPEEEKDAEKIISCIEENGVTRVHFVPSMLGAFMEMEEREKVRRLGTLQTVFASGEALSPDHVNRFGKIMHGIYGTRLVNLYGPTEATVDVSYHEVDFSQANEIIPIGKPIDNLRLYIVDEHMQLKPKGVAGELCIGGVGLARGYLNNAELTNAKFVNVIHAGAERVYKTGDLARYLPDGSIAFLGRLDDQIKIRGYRIEPGEIETQIMLYDNVKQVLVTSFGSADVKKIVAFLVSKENTALNTFELKKFLKAQLPDYMIPTLIRKVDKFPLTNNGKVNIKSMLLSIDKFSSEKTDFIQPTTEIEVDMANMWSELLMVNKISVNDNFFDIGGHSIILMRLNAMVNDKYNVQLPFNLYFNNTLEQIAQEVKETLNKREVAEHL